MLILSKMTPEPAPWEDMAVRLRPFIEIARRAAGRLPAIAGPEPVVR